jgi:hypothetical protein
MKSAIDIIKFTTAAALLMMALAPCARAQGADDEGRRNECRRGSASERRRCENEIGTPDSPAAVLGGSGRPAQFDETSLPLALINEDLGYLQNVVDYLTGAASQGGALDLKAVGRTASEVRKRAARLRESLALPHPQKGARRREESNIGDVEQLREALSELVADAARNPVLRGYMLDPAMSAEAWRDLDEIVELCDRIKTGSETLVKTRR